ncbi:MAG: hypothetical protein SAL07_05310 [Oscillatoria sp. PMC 1051.18]|uniref:hypothetical protein n=1 Tax=Oscillatoria salina TaxID=331517 RepID=UPI0013BDA3D7|nr:hypothetical protein [Oscillatoria salina]MBZ8178489.1 hypothetical protein [Oscillatoria salina IIICB1]MEC4892821.1 hypothetical protein [Oscillatoria sp. PMC 1050.18]MEC5029312.1 hypothetical protein [Oscillatoria sp. PMC 1051.18]NET88015.1 hypothetical protein [Kamptonema sp. SIO1D9]
MRLRELRDIYLNQDIYIVGSGPTANLFPMEFLRDKICLGLNDAYKIHPAIAPIVLMNHQLYAHAGKKVTAPYHENFKNIKYPILKPASRYKIEKIEWDHPYFYCFDRTQKIQDLWNLTKDTDYLYYSPQGCSLHPALQVCWIMGAKNIFVLGCDSRTIGGNHYANYDKNDFGVVARERNYDAYVYGTLIVQKFLQTKGVNVINLSPIVGYHMIDYQHEVLKGEISTDSLVKDIKKLKNV